MRYLILILLCLVCIATNVRSQTIEGVCYEMVKPSPWAQSMIVSDTTEIAYDLKKITGVKIRLVQDWSRFAPDYKGENYKEFDIKIDSRGRFKIDFSMVQPDKLIVVEASKDGFIKLWYTLRMDNFPFTDKVKLILVPKIKY